jgi:hypothetical protein
MTKPWAGWACRLASYSTFWLPYPAGALHPGGQPVQADRLAGACHLRKPVAQVVQAGDEGAVGLAVPEGGQRARQQVQAVRRPRSWRSDRPPGTPVRQPSESTAATASKRTSKGSGGVPAWPGGAVAAGRRGGWPPSPARLRAARSAGSMTRGPDLQAGVRHLAYGLVPVNVRTTHKASRTASFISRYVARGWSLGASASGRSVRA